MAYIEFNNNPVGRRVGDCAVRAVSKALDITWETAYISLALNGLQMGDVMNADSVWGATLRQHGYQRKAISSTCPDCYDIKEFCKEFPTGTYVVGTGGHVVTIIDGDYFDSWDSGDETPQYYWSKEV